MALIRCDLTVRNNTDWVRRFALNARSALTAPWANVAPWASSVSYQGAAPASVVQFAGDLYVASQEAGSWTSGASFGDEAANWVKVGTGNLWDPQAYDLTGAVLKMSICKTDVLGNIAMPKRLVLQTTSDGSDGAAAGLIIQSPTTSGIFNLSLPKSRTAACNAGVYGYDLTVEKGGIVLPVLNGRFTVLAGAAP